MPVVVITTNAVLAQAQTVNIIVAHADEFPGTVPKNSLRRKDRQGAEPLKSKVSKQGFATNRHISLRISLRAG